MRAIASLLVVLAPAVSRADVSESSSELETLASIAYREASAGHCDSVAPLAARIRELDATYFHKTFETTTAIVACRQRDGEVRVADQPHENPASEASLGLGVVHERTNSPLVALELGIGTLLGSHATLSLHGAVKLYRRSEMALVGLGGPAQLRSLETDVVSILVGPALQLWLDEHAWLGFGTGIAVYRRANSPSDGLADYVCADGVYFGVRGGYSFGRTNHRFNVSADVTVAGPQLQCDGTSSSEKVGGAMIALVAGYQFL